MLDTIYDVTISKEKAIVKEDKKLVFTEGDKGTSKVRFFIIDNKDEIEIGDDDEFALEYLYKKEDVRGTIENDKFTKATDKKSVTVVLDDIIDKAGDYDVILVLKSTDKVKHLAQLSLSITDVFCCGNN